MHHRVKTAAISVPRLNETFIPLHVRAKSLHHEYKLRIFQAKILNTNAEILLRPLLSISTTLMENEESINNIMEISPFERRAKH